MPKLIPAFDINSASTRIERLTALLQHEVCVVVRVARVQGSAPREPGAWMAVFKQALIGSVGAATWSTRRLRMPARTCKAATPHCLVR